jgi:hypothetical protein
MMPSQQLKTLIRRLFEDEHYLRAFLTAPERVLDRASIVPEERRAVLRLHGVIWIEPIDRDTPIKSHPHEN